MLTPFKFGTPVKRLMVKNIKELCLLNVFLTNAYFLAFIDLDNEEILPLDEDDLIKFMAIYDNKEVNNDEVEGKIQLLTAHLTRYGLKFATNMEQHLLTHDLDIKRELKLQRNRKLCIAGY
ncbi:hypothetical protein TNCV_2299531 [Trichonephila clavipes]|nr:hypothetical protein TNCV_2299531 [Trichonephila clavipes]